MSLDETLRRLPPGANRFVRGLFDHHWREASWLYERREALAVQGPLVPFDRWREVERRAGAHVVALERGDQRVLDSCEDKALNGDVGELNTAVRLLARTGRSEALIELVDGLDWYEPARARAVSDALIWDAPPQWQSVIAQLLADDGIPEDAVGPLARVAGVRSWSLGGVLAEALERQTAGLDDLAWAAGRLGLTATLPRLYALIEGADEPRVRQAAALAALRFAPGEVLAFVQQVLASEDWAAIPFALAAGPSGHEALAQLVAAAPSKERLLAVGLLGHAHGIELLLGALEREEWAATAARALFVLTGAPLHRETHRSVFGGEPGDDEEQDDRPRGLLISRLPTSRSSWSEWLQEHGPAERDARLRGGVRFDPLEVVAQVIQATTTSRVRGWMIDELSIRYRMEVPIWPSQLHAAQQAIARQFDGTPSDGAKVVPGAWYRAGQPLWSP